MVTFIRLMNRRLRTKRQWHSKRKKKECTYLKISDMPLFGPLFCPVSPFFASIPLSFTLPFLFLSACCANLVSLAHMAHSSDYVRIAPDRSRSRDEPMWQNRNQQRRSQYRDTWHEVPPVRRPRQVLTIVNLEAVRPLMAKVHGDVMDSTTCDALPSLGRMEELVLFTYQTMSWSTHTMWKHSRWTTCTTSANTSCTRGIVILNPLLWISVGKTRLGTHSSFPMSTAWLIFSMNLALIGLKVKNLGSCFRTTFDLSRPRISHIYHAPELPWGTSQPQHASINGKKARLAPYLTPKKRFSSSHVCLNIALTRFLFNPVSFLSSWLQF